MHNENKRQIQAVLRTRITVHSDSDLSIGKKNGRRAEELACEKASPRLLYSTLSAERLPALTNDGSMVS